LKFRRQAESWNRAEKSQYLLQRLRFVVRRAYAETDYYRELFDRIGFDTRSEFGFDEFALIPVLEREDIRTAGRALISNRMSMGQLQKDATGGSTGSPTELWLGPEERGWKESAGEYFMRRMGVPSGARTGLLWGHNLDPHAPTSLRERLYALQTNSRYFDCLRLSRDTLDQYHSQFESWRPTTIIAYASALGHLAEHILERRLRPN